MKSRYNLLYALLLSLLISCKLYESSRQDTREDTEMEWQHREQHKRYYTFRQDTLSRSWYFWTDSAFRFHADSGLFAKSGYLGWQGSEGSTRKYMQDLTQENQQGKQKAVRHERNSNKWLSVKYFWSLGFILILLLFWRWGKSRLFL